MSGRKFIGEEGEGERYLVCGWEQTILINKPLCIDLCCPLSCRLPHQGPPYAHCIALAHAPARNPLITMKITENKALACK